MNVGFRRHENGSKINRKESGYELMSAYKTYKDFPEFYAHPFIQSIAGNTKWTVSDNQKRPIDMKALLYDHKVYGARMDFETEASNPCVTLQRLCDILPNAANHAYFLNAIVDKFVVLDIEPKCPDKIKKKLLDTSFVYGEVSMSGKGYHLIYPLPEILNEYPVAQKKIVMKEEHGYYEILLNHWVTFTRNMISPKEKPKHDFTVFFEELAKLQKEVIRANIEIDEPDTENIPKYDYLTEILSHCVYSKKPEDFHGDISKYEYGHIGFLYWNLKKLLNISYIKAAHEYTPSEKAWMLYTVAKEKIPRRDKHEEYRNNLPWLLYLAGEIIAKSD